MEYLSSIYLRNDSKNVKIISENESYLSTKLDVRNLSGKFVRIAVFAGTALICAVFAGLIIAQLIPFPVFPQITPVIYIIIAMLLFAVPCAGILVMEYKAVRMQLTWMSVCAAVILIVVLVVQGIFVPTLLAESIHSATTEEAAYGIYDLPVQKKLETAQFLPDCGDGGTVVAYRYEYAPLLQSWEIYAEIRWTDEGQYEGEIARLAQQAEDAQENGIRKALVTTAYLEDAATRQIQYYIGSGIREVPELLSGK